MAMYEINKHADSFAEWLFWKYGSGPTITVRWPVGEIIIVGEEDPRWDWTMSASKQSFESADPNDHYRPYLEKNVGKQNRDWMWKIGPTAADNGFGTRGYDTLLIKFRKSKAKWATVAALIWG
jgi:hypothetical protein